eukprot:GHVT01094558.1.p1 GENE.GHVT01094558.1~~GHVT01094558.1.p1  ORF type:complete len:313 (+),score=17.73 GHVT01094558.1:2074-3012(+)
MVRVDAVVPPKIALGLHGGRAAEDFFERVLKFSKNLNTKNPKDSKLANLLIEHSDPTVFSLVRVRTAELFNRSAAFLRTAGVADPTANYPEMSIHLAVRELVFRQFGLLLPIGGTSAIMHAPINAEVIREAIQARIAAGRMVAPCSQSVDIQSDERHVPLGLQYDNQLANARIQSDATRSAAFNFIQTRLQTAVAFGDLMHRTNSHTANILLGKQNSGTWIANTERQVSSAAVTTPESMERMVFPHCYSDAFQIIGEPVQLSIAPGEPPAVSIPFRAIRLGCSLENEPGASPVVAWRPPNWIDDAYDERPLP